MWSKPHKHNKLSPVSPEVVEIYRNTEFGENSIDTVHARSVTVTKTGQITSKNVGISKEHHIKAELHLPGLQERCDTSANPDLFKLSKMLSDNEYVNSKAYQGNKHEDTSHMEGNSVAKGNDSGRRSKNVYTWNRTVQVPKKYFKRNLTDQLVDKPMVEKQPLNARILDKININRTWGKAIPKAVATIGLRSVSKGVGTVAVRPIEKPSHNRNEMQSSIEKKAKRSKKPKLQTNNNYSCEPSDASCYETAESNRKSNVVRPTVKKEEINTVLPVIPAPVPVLSVGNQTNLEDFEDQPKHPGKLYDRINKILTFVDNWLIYAVFIFLLTIIYMIHALHNDISEYSIMERRYLSKMKSSGILYKIFYYAMRILKVPVF